MEKIKLICLRINNDELITTDKDEWLKFIKRHRGKVSSIEQFNWKIPGNKLQKALEYSFDELYKFKQKENRRETD
ncbi:hypothetical protein [Leptotrichia wadei]|uniref:Uncharacterized protein n=1 Tax=Leptotrichia wadei (strain F0279) TaxID=888055 RepID=U2PMB3_LEPWF|nr:hypothetical protein [Leptotrichia wadei]ERK51680.1 hypothetical protein HMPREF9015_01063 [Leptotrichia wadei F0279]